MNGSMSGRRLSHYVVEHEIGSGGMGIVYRGSDVMLGRLVAIKALYPHLGRDEQLRQRFRNEARIQANLTHANIIALYDLVEDGADLFFVMEYVDGKPLDHLIGREIGPIPSERALPLFIQILSAVEFAHKRNVVHRDIKPANILVSSDGSVKVGDFGIAKVMGSERVTKTGAKIGTLEYMSPELVKGSEATIQSDIYSLAITLFEMLAGRVPYDSKTTSEFEIMQAIVQGSLPDPREFYPHIPEHLVAALRKGASVQAELRFRNCAEFRSALGNTEAQEGKRSEYETAPAAAIPARAAQSAPIPQPSAAPMRASPAATVVIECMDEPIMGLVEVHANGVCIGRISKSGEYRYPSTTGLVIFQVRWSSGNSRLENVTLRGGDNRFILKKTNSMDWILEPQSVPEPAEPPAASQGTATMRIRGYDFQEYNLRSLDFEVDGVRAEGVWLDNIVHIACRPGQRTVRIKWGSGGGTSSGPFMVAIQQGINNYEVFNDAMARIGLRRVAAGGPKEIGDSKSALVKIVLAGLLTIVVFGGCIACLNSMK